MVKRMNKKWIIMSLMKVQRVKYFNGVFRKLIYVAFLGIENFLSNFPKENLDICFRMLEEILIFSGQEGIEIFWKKFTKSEFDGDLMEVLCHMIKRKNL
jgi:hypothetical protein